MVLRYAPRIYVNAKIFAAVLPAIAKAYSTLWKILRAACLTASTAEGIQSKCSSHLAADTPSLAKRNHPAKQNLTACLSFISAVHSLLERFPSREQERVLDLLLRPLCLRHEHMCECLSSALRIAEEALLWSCRIDPLSSAPGRRQQRRRQCYAADVAPGNWRGRGWRSSTCPGLTRWQEALPMTHSVSLYRRLQKEILRRCRTGPSLWG